MTDAEPHEETEDGPEEAGPVGPRLPLLAAGSVLAFGIYAGFGQSTFYREDGFQLVYNWLLRGNVAHEIHPLYLPLANAFCELFAFTGLGVFRLATTFSALAAALGVLAVGLWGRRAALSTADTLRLIALVAFCPPVFFFATVIEFHALFFLFAALAFLAAEGLATPEPENAPFARRAPPALVLALTTWTASLAHSTGTLLVPLLCIWIVARTRVAQRWFEVVVFGGTHVVLAALATPLVHAALGIDPAHAESLGDWFDKWLRFEGALGRAPMVLLEEALFPYFPLSLIVVLPFMTRPRASSVAWCLAGFLPYYVLCVLVLADRGTGEPLREHGSYLLPLSLPLAWILVRTLPESRDRMRAGLLALAVLCSLLQVRQHDQRPSAEYGEALRGVLDESETVLLSGLKEAEWVVVEAPGARPFQLLEALQSSGPAELEQWLQGTRAVLDALIARGGRVLLSAQARAELQALVDAGAQRAALAERVLEFFDTTWAREPVRLGAFQGFELVPKS